LELPAEYAVGGDVGVVDLLDVDGDAVGGQLASQRHESRDDRVLDRRGREEPGVPLAPEARVGEVDAATSTVDVGEDPPADRSRDPLVAGLAGRELALRGVRHRE